MNLARIAIVLVVAVGVIAWWVSTQRESGSSSLDDVHGVPAVTSSQHELVSEELATKTFPNGPSAAGDARPASIAVAAPASPAMQQPTSLCSVRGCVRDGRTDAAITAGRDLDPRMMVRFTRPGERERKAILGENGCYASVLITPGSWTARAMVPGTWRQERTIEIVPGQREAVLDFVLAVKPDVRWRVVVEHAVQKRVVMQGTEIPARVFTAAVSRELVAPLRVVARSRGAVPPSELDESTIVESEADMDRGWSMPEGDDLVTSGRLPTFDASPPFDLDLVDGARTIDRRTVEDVEREVEIRVPIATLLAGRGALHLRTIDAQTRKPIATSIELHGIKSLHGEVDADAWFPIVPAGEYVVEIEAEPARRSLLPCTIEAGKLTDLGDVLVGGESRVTGVVLGEERFAGLFQLQLFSLDALESTPPRIQWVGTAILDDERRFAFAQVPAGRLVLRHDRRNFDWGIEDVDLEVRAGKEHALELRLRPVRTAGIEFTSFGPDRHELPVVEWFDAHGRLVANEWAAQLLAGSYRVRVSSQGRTRKELELVLDRVRVIQKVGLGE